MNSIKMSESGKTVSESIISTVREEVERGEIISYGEEKKERQPEPDEVKKTNKFSIMDPNSVRRRITELLEKKESGC